MWRLKNSKNSCSLAICKKNNFFIKKLKIVEKELDKQEEKKKKRKNTRNF